MTSNLGLLRLIPDDDTPAWRVDALEDAFEVRREGQPTALVAPTIARAAAAIAETLSAPGKLGSIVLARGQAVLAVLDRAGQGWRVWIEERNEAKLCAEHAELGAALAAALALVLPRPVRRGSSPAWRAS